MAKKPVIPSTKASTELSRMSSEQVKKLNKEQLEAVRYKKGPLLIIAGAGTGKTTVITERIKYLISKELAKPSEILALTFTEKAAREMEERVDVAMPYGYTQMWISTFHSFCDRVLRDEALQIGLNPRYKLMTQAETVQFVRKNLFKFELKYFRPLGNPTKFIDSMIQHFSRLQDEDIAPTEYIRWSRAQNLKLLSLAKRSGAGKTQNNEEKIESEKWSELAGAYKTYEELKVKEGMMDFGDLIVKTLLLFRQRSNVLSEYRRKFKYVLVDEFQDTNIAQYELVKLLAPPKMNGNLTVVGDDSQSIYKFRGAAVSNIVHFMKTYKKAKTVVLTKNYRSTQAILDPAYRLIQHNNPDTLETKLGIDKNLIAERGLSASSGSHGVHFIHVDRVENEADAVAKEIKKLISNNESAVLKYGDIAILVRANNHAEPFIRAFQRHAVPYQFLGPGRLFRQPEIIDLISYLKVLYDFDDSVSFYRLLSIDYFDISPRDLVRMGNYAKRLNLSLFEAAEKVDDIFVSSQTREKVKKITSIVNRHLKLIKKETAGQLMYYFLEDSGLIQNLINPDSIEVEKKVANISKFFDKLKTYEVDHEDATVVAVVDWLELSSELGESPLAADVDWTRVNAINILTVHSAKGLEFPVVFLVNLVGQRFPTIERREQIPIPEDLIKEVLPSGDYHEQEERRLFYVGMTRAMDWLYFTAADYYGEGKREKKLSPFIFEALGDEAVAAEPFDDAQGKQLSFLDYEPKAKPSEALAKEGQPQPFHIDYLSYSQIETFRICPLHYKLKYILRIPTPPSAAQSFGTSIHSALRDFYMGVKSGGKPTIKLIEDTLEGVWISDGYKSKSHEQRSYEAAQKYLNDYYKQEFDPQKLPLTLEQSFVIPLNSRAGGGSPLKIGGRIDRVDGLRDGGIEIIDYKTGANVPTQKQVDHNLQLTFYALAGATIPDSPFGKKLQDIKLSLYYFDGMSKITTTRSKEQLNATVVEIFKVREEIEKSDFRCSGHMFCENCEYSLLCRADK